MDKGGVCTVGYYSATAKNRISLLQQCGSSWKALYYMKCQRKKSMRSFLCGIQKINEAAAGSQIQRRNQWFLVGSGKGEEIWSRG